MNADNWLCPRSSVFIRVPFPASLAASSLQMHTRRLPAPMQADYVNAWSERVSIPTYRIGAPNKNPMFLEKRIYQGSSGAVYPHPVIDQVFDEKHDQEYTALFLENRYLNIMILPEI